MVGDVRFAGEGDGNNFHCLIIVERLKDEPVEIFDVDGSSAGVAGGFNGVFGQGVSWRTMAGRNALRERAAAIGDTNGGLARE